MAYLTSSSTNAEVVAAYRDNASYDLQGSVAMCKLFIDACRQLLQRMNKAVEHGEERLEEDPAAIQGELGKAEAWWRANDTGAVMGMMGGRVTYADVSRVRG